MFSRALEAMPALLTWLLVTAPFWAGLVSPVPFALAIIGFDVFWLYLSLSTALRALKGYGRLLAARREDWHQRYRAAAVRYFGEEQGKGWCDGLPDGMRMARFRVHPSWVGVLDFDGMRRVPSALAG